MLLFSIGKALKEPERKNLTAGNYSCCSHGCTKNTLGKQFDRMVSMNLFPTGNRERVKHLKGQGTRIKESYLEKICLGALLVTLAQAPDASPMLVFIHPIWKIASNEGKAA